MTCPPLRFSAALTPENAVPELERVIDVALRERRPAYITIACDYAHMPVAGTPVKGVPLADVPAAHSDQAELDAAVEAIGAALAGSRRPVILPAFTLARYGLAAQAEALAAATGIPFAATAMDKGIPLPEFPLEPEHRPPDQRVLPILGIVLFSLVFIHVSAALYYAAFLK